MDILPWVGGALIGSAVTAVVMMKFTEAIGAALLIKLAEDGRISVKRGKP